MADPFTQRAKQDQSDFERLMTEYSMPTLAELALFSVGWQLTEQQGRALLHADTNAKRLEILASAVSASRG